VREAEAVKEVDERDRRLQGSKMGDERTIMHLERERERERERQRETETERERKGGLLAGDRRLLGVSMRHRAKHSDCADMRPK
jgi:hypothetical protein